MKGNEDEVEFWLSRLNISSHDVGKAIDRLGQIGDPRAVEPLIRCLKDEVTFSDLGSEIIESLIKIGDERAYKPLLERLMNQNTRDYCRGDIAESLHQVGGNQAITPLISLLTDDHDLEDL